jgi:hypothetical protein
MVIQNHKAIYEICGKEGFACSVNYYKLVAKELKNVAKEQALAAEALRKSNQEEMSIGWLNDGKNATPVWPRIESCHHISSHSDDFIT